MAPSPESQRAPRVEVGTALAESEAKAAAWQEAVAESALDPSLWTGAFATNVWGGRYEMDGMLARGGQGCTFLGTDRKTGARVVAKVLDLKHASDWKRVELFEREARTLKEVEHPGVPRLLEVLEDEETGARALIMTHVPGDDLAKVLSQGGPLAEPGLWRVLVDVVDVLRSLHGAPSPIVHRDIKPKNLVRRPEGGISVVDFGGVGAIRQGDASTVVGTFGYMAPEQLYGHASPATDLYSLGATLLTLATGTEPEDQPRNGLAIDVDKAAPRLSAPLRALLSRLLSPDPNARPRDAVALSQELNRIYEESRGTAKARKGGWRKEARADWDEARADLFSDEDVEKAKEDLDTGVDFIAGLLTVVLGVLGTVGTVIVGEVILPVILSLAIAFASPDGKKRLEQARSAVKTGAQVARASFKGTIDSGVKQMRSAEARRRQRLPRGRPKSTRSPQVGRRKGGRGR